MKFRERLTNADLDMTMHARNHGWAKLEIWYFGEKNGLVRKKLIINPQEVDEFFDKGIDED